MSYEFEKKNVLITVKTYPTPSKKYVETVCTAGITDEGKWIRLYPIKFRQLEDEKHYKLFTWINVEAKRSSDFRPESYKVNHDSLITGKFLEPKKDIHERRRWLLPLVKSSFEQIRYEYDSSKTSLAIFKPYKVEDLIIEQVSREWSHEEIEKLSQVNFFDNDSQISQLEKVPYEFSLRYKCQDDNCKGHNQKITNWEIYQTYRKYIQKYGSEEIALNNLKEKWLSFFSEEKDAYLIVGTVFPHPTFIIIGHFSYPKAYLKQIDGQMDMFSNINS